MGLRGKKNEGDDTPAPATTVGKPGVGLELGLRARDTISGFEGTLGSKTEFMNGCFRWGIDGVDKDGMPKGYIFDAEQIVLIDLPVAERAPLQRTGGSRESTTERPNPAAR